MDEKERSEGLPRWAMEPTHGPVHQADPCVALGRLVIYVLLTGGAHARSSMNWPRGVEKETVGLPAGCRRRRHMRFESRKSGFRGLDKDRGHIGELSVVQTKAEPQYYLRRSFRGSYSIAGTPFSTHSATWKGDRTHHHGHNMNDGSMFADIAGYTHETYWREHPIIQCDSLTRQREYEVMAVLQFKDSEQAWRRTIPFPVMK